MTWNEMVHACPVRCKEVGEEVAINRKGNFMRRNNLR
jgi:hypothetical protein